MSTTHPQVGAYLDDLARMLTDIDPGERDDILASVREHLDAEIGDGDGGDAVVHAALLRLGPPEQVAAEARAGQTGPAPHSGPRGPDGAAPPRHPRRTRTAAGVCLAVVAILALSALAGRLAALAAHVAGGWPDSTSLLPHPSEVLIFLPLSFPVWLLALVVVLLGQEASARTKTNLAALGPATSVVVLASTFWSDPTVLSTPVCLAGLGAVLAWIVVTARRLWRETHS